MSYRCCICPIRRCHPIWQYKNSYNPRLTVLKWLLCVSIYFSIFFLGLVGLAISYALSVTNLLSGLLTSFTETEKEMVSVERAMQYITGAPTENRHGDSQVSMSSSPGQILDEIWSGMYVQANLLYFWQPPLNWPSRGVLEFKSVVLTYRLVTKLAIEP